jgi:hypothetical protein
MNYIYIEEKISWDVKLCGLIEVYHSFKGMYCLHILIVKLPRKQQAKLTMEALHSSTMLVNFTKVHGIA